MDLAVTATPENQLAVLWTTVQPGVAAYIAAAVPNHADAEDILQKVAVVVFSKYHQFDTNKSFLAWVTGIARNEILRWRRDKARDRHVFDGEVLDRLASVQPEVDAQMKELRQALDHCVEKATGRARQLIELRYQHDLKPAEIARRLGTTSASIRVMLSRVRTALVDCVERRMNGERTQPSGGIS